MKTLCRWHKKYTFYFSTLLILAAFIGVQTQATDSINSPEFAVLIVLDGFRPDYITIHEAPTLRQLISEGVWVEHAVGVFPSNSTVNQTSLVTGAYPNTTGIPNNSRYDRMTDEILTGLRDNRATTISEVFRSAGLRTASVSHYMVEGKVDTYSRNFGEALLMLRGNKKPNLLIYLNLSIDSAGHQSGPFSPQTARAVKQADDEIRLLIDTMKDQGIYENSVFVVVSDHGMSPTGGQLIRPNLEYQLWTNGFTVAQTAREIHETTDIVHLQHGSAFLYLREGRFTEERYDKLVNILGAIEGVDVLDHTALKALHTDPERLGDVVIVPQAGYTLYPGTGNTGIHGRPQEQQITLLFVGPGFRKGVILQEAEIVDVVPTLLHLFNLPIPSTVDGKVLTEALM